jgi:HEAT repeats
MDDLDSYTANYLEGLKGDDRDTAYHKLIEADHAILSTLINAYRTETEPSVRATLVEIIWQHRVPETISFLSEALLDSHPQVWKSALDGFVSLGDPSALQTLELAKQQIQRADTTRSIRIDWIDEAIQQIRNSSFA